MRTTPRCFLAMALAFIATLSGCSVVTERDVAARALSVLHAQDGDVGDLPRKRSTADALKVALEQGGVAYRWGGDSPSEGFDCSGLVYFSFTSVGINLPRTAHEMFRNTRRIGKRELQPGDLVFFRLRSSRISHVGIYAGNGQFVHAPSKGKDVEVALLDNPFWKKRFAGAGRV